MRGFFKGPPLARVAAMVVVWAIVSAALAEAAVPLTREQRISVERLKKTALAADAAASEAALKELHDMGDPAHAALIDTLRQLLSRDRTAIEQGFRVANSASKFRELSQQAAELRRKARENIAKLDHNETLKLAHDYQAALQSMFDKLNAGCQQLDPAVRAIARRPALLSKWQEITQPTDRGPNDEEEKNLAEKWQKNVGFSPEEAAAIPDVDDDAPDVPLLQDLWLYRASRRIERYNDSLKVILSPGEFENLRFLNRYRECLGLLPLELDPRLVKAARAHSAEMAALDYFSHESPVAENKDMTRRMKLAEYPLERRLCGENIAKGVHTGEEAFRGWFDSPGHHKNMARSGFTAVGIGQSGVLWTQNFGASSRLMLATPEERTKVIQAAGPSKRPRGK